MNQTNILRIGTRRSRLARAQSEEVIDLLRTIRPEIYCRIEPITTTGDRLSQHNKNITEAGGKGLFVSEIESALITGRIDLAVHSLKDIPLTPASGTVLGAVPRRLAPTDALVTTARCALMNLPAGASVGTGSVRRSAQIMALRRDLKIVPIQGNVETRLEKVRRRRIDATLLAVAGLTRLGLTEEIDEELPLEQMVPAAGQGALGLQIRSDDRRLADILDPLDHKPSRIAVEAERSLARRLGAHCRSSVGLFSQVRGVEMEMQAVVLSPDGDERIFIRNTAPLVRRDELLERIADELHHRGAKRLLDKASG